MAEGTAVAEGVAGGRTTKGTGARLVDAFLVRREASILLVAVGLVIYFQSSNADFLSTSNLGTLAQFIAATAIIAAAQVMLMISGEIDLSVGQVYAFTPFIMFFGTESGLPWPLAIVVALVAAAGIGFVNGGITQFFGVPSFITTLGTFFAINGVTLTISDGFPRSPPDAGFLSTFIASTPFAGFMIAIVIVICMQVLLKNTRWGLHTVATGGNLIGAGEAGIRINRVKIGNFMLASTLAGFVGIIEGTRIDSFDPLAGGTTIMFAAVSAAVIGGTALAGGSGTVAGAFVGAIVLGVLRDGFTLQGVSAFTFDLILGVAIILAMTLNVYLARLRRAGRV